MQYDKALWVEIGYDVDHMIQINNVVNWADRIVSPDGDMLYPMQFINLSSPVGIHDNHKYWEMEMVLDTTYLINHANPHQHWAYYLDVQAVGAVQPAVRCGYNPPAFNNYPIEWLKVYVREGDGSQTELVYADEDEGVVWCVGETAEFSNEEGERHQTITYRFICLQEKEKTHSAAGTWTRAEGTHGYPNEEPMKFMRINEVDFGGGEDFINILSFEDEFNMGMTPQFLPNIFQGQDVKEDQRWRVLTMIVDSETDVFEDVGLGGPFYGVTIPNVALPDFQVEFTLVDGPQWVVGTQQVWEYTGGTNNVSYLLSRREGEINADIPRDTIEYTILTTCDRVITTV